LQRRGPIAPGLRRPRAMREGPRHQAEEQPGRGAGDAGSGRREEMPVVDGGMLGVPRACMGKKAP